MVWFCWEQEWGWELCSCPQGAFCPGELRCIQQCGVLPWQGLAVLVSVPKQPLRVNLGPFPFGKGNSSVAAGVHSPSSLQSEMGLD